MKSLLSKNENYLVKHPLRKESAAGRYLVKREKPLEIRNTRYERHSSLTSYR
jgi:hypothetical protein